MKGMNKGSHAPNHQATAKGGKANKAEGMAVVKDVMSYSKSYGTIGGKKKAQK